MAGVQGQGTKVASELKVLRKSRIAGVYCAGDGRSVDKREMGITKPGMVDETVPEVWIWADNYKSELLEVRVFDSACGASG